MNEQIPERIDPELEMLRLNKEGGYNYRERRSEDWTDNYTLYRDKVKINRLTQRQSVNVPLMKQTVRTLLKDVDDMPVLYFENLDNDKQKEVFLNEYWNWTVDVNNMEIFDIVDKRQAFLFGRTFDQWQIVDGMVKCTNQDPEDILVSRYTDPTDLNSSRFLIHTNIFTPLSVIKSNPDYDKAAVKKLVEFYNTEPGLSISAKNEQMLIDKNQKMVDMGLNDVNDPVLGEKIVNITLQFVYREDDGDDSGDEQIYLYVEADDEQILMKEPLESVIGTTEDNFWRNHYPYVSWADDVERQDFWSDGVADIVRTPNKVLNSWFSQLVENRTLRNFGMHYYNSKIEGFAPQTFNPVPWGWYGVPVPHGGNLSDVFQKVDIPDLSESIDEMGFIIGMVEKASGATATQQGVQTQGQVTLGEVELALGEAKERVKGMSKFYTKAWKQRGEIFLKLIEASGDKLDAVRIYKKGKNTNDIFTREIEPKDWQSKLGYRVKIWSQDERNAENTETLQKLNAVLGSMPENMRLREIYNRKLLEFADLSPDEINSVMEQEQQAQDQLLEGTSSDVLGSTGEQVEGEDEGLGNADAVRKLESIRGRVGENR